MHKIYGWLPDSPDQRDFTMPYEYLEILAADFWTIRK